MSKVLIAGHGPHHVIAVHGWFGSASAWQPLANVVDGERFTYAFMDCRGYGERRAEPGPYDMQTIAGDILGLADGLGWQCFDLVGHSMGGKAIQLALAQAPARVRKLVAVTPVPAAGVPFDDAAWALFSSAAGNAQAREAIVSHSTGNRLSAHWARQIVAHSLKESTPQAFGAYLASWAREDHCASLAHLAGHAHPMLILVGEHDPGLTAEVMQATYLPLYPHARIETIANAGHYPMDETPVALATSIERFLCE